MFIGDSTTRSLVCFNTYFVAKKTGLTAQATLLHGDPRRVTPGLEDRPPKIVRNLLLYHKAGAYPSLIKAVSNEVVVVTLSIFMVYNVNPKPQKCTRKAR